MKKIKWGDKEENVELVLPDLLLLKTSQNIHNGDGFQIQ